MDIRRDEKIYKYLDKKINANDQKIRDLMSGKRPRKNLNSQKGRKTYYPKNKKNYLPSSRNNNFLHEDVKKNYQTTYTKSTEKRNKFRKNKTDTHYLNEKKHKREYSEDHINEMIDEMLERFDESLKFRNNKISTMQQEKLDNELIECTHKPKINERSRKLTENLKGDFYERQLKYNERVKKKEEKVREAMLKEQEEKVLFPPLYEN